MSTTDGQAVLDSFDSRERRKNPLVTSTAVLLVISLGWESYDSQTRNNSPATLTIFTKSVQFGWNHPWWNHETLRSLYKYVYKAFFLVNHLNSIYHYLSNLGPSIFIACWGLGTNLGTAYVMLPTRVAWSHPSHRRRSTGVEDGACWKHRQRQRMPDLSYFIVIWPTYLHLLLLLLALSIRGSVVYHFSSQDRNQVVDSRWMIWVQIFLPPKQMLRNST